MARLSFFSTVSQLVDVARVVAPHFRRDAKIGTKESGPQLGDQLFNRVPFIPKALAAKVAIQPRRVARPMRQLMRQRGAVAFGIAEAFKRRHLDVIATHRVISLITTVANVLPVAAKNASALATRSSFVFGCSAGW